MKFLGEERCLLLGDTLAVADFHNGIEYSLEKKGVIVPSQTEEKLGRLSAVIEETKPKKLVIVGDLKHNIPITSRQEWVEVPHFIQKIKSLVSDIIIVKGNHDGNIERLVDVPVVTEYVDNKVGFLHGHTTPTDEILSCETIVSAHAHPSIALNDIKPRVEQVWLESQIGDSKLVVLPAFDLNARGAPLNRSEPCGPVLRTYADLSGAEVYLLDGTYLGTLKDLR